MANEASSLRTELVHAARQIVVKAGTRLLTDRERIKNLVDGIAMLRREGKQVLLVTSGAVGMGMVELGLRRRPRELARIQALAAVGQCRLMAIYSELAAQHGFSVAQLLLTAADLRSRERYLNVMNCIEALWSRNILPIVNENDSVSVDELKFGDNDTLSAALATMTRSELTVILTTESGLRSRNADGSLGERISVVSKLDERIMNMAGGTDNSEFSIGGMASKLRAAKMLTAAGETLWISDGRDPEMLAKIARGEDVGTLFIPAGHVKMHNHKRYLRFFAGSSGCLSVDDGAAEAIRRHGKSLLPSGVLSCTGRFRRGDAVDIVDRQGRNIGRGLVNFDSEDCAKLIGHKSSDIAKLLGRDADEELIHRNHLTVSA